MSHLKGVNRLLTHTKIIEPSFAASPGARRNHMPNPGEQVCCTDTQEIHMGTQAQMQTRVYRKVTVCAQQ